MLTPSFVEDKELDTWLQSEARWNNYAETIREVLKNAFQDIEEASRHLDVSLNFYLLKKHLNKAFFVMLKNNKAKRYKASLKYNDDRLYFEDDRLMQKQMYSRDGYPFDLIQEFTDAGNTYYSPNTNNKMDSEFYAYLKSVTDKINALRKRYEKDKAVFTITKEIKSSFNTLKNDKNSKYSLSITEVNSLKATYIVRDEYETKFDFEILAKTNKTPNHIISRVQLDERDIWCRPIIAKNVLGLCEDAMNEINKRIQQAKDLEQELIQAIPSKYNELIMIEELKK